MQSWSDGRILDLLAEGRTIQKRTFKGLVTAAGRKAPSLARSFAKRMFQGKCHSAFQLLEEESGSAGVLGEDDALPSGQTVSEALRSKHPDAQGLKQDALLLPDTLPPLPDQVIFECIDADLIRHAAKQTKGSAGPSGLNAHAWRRMCCSFKEASDGLCHSLTLLARRLCTQFIHPSILAPLLACRLVALDKNPGVQVSVKSLKESSQKQSSLSLKETFKILPDHVNFVEDRSQVSKLRCTQSESSLRMIQQRPSSWSMPAMLLTA